MSNRGYALYFPPEITEKINSDYVKAYLNNEISGDWAAAVESIALSLFDVVAENVNKHNHKEETTHILTNLCIQLSSLPDFVAEFIGKEEKP